MENKNIDTENIPNGMSATEIFTHQIVIGSSASAGVRTIILDTEEEYKSLVEGLGGKMIKLTPGSGTFINPLNIIDSKIDKLAYKAQKLLNEKKYVKAYKIMAKMKKLKI